MRRGQLEIAARLDLHGHTQDAARRALERFLADAADEGARIVLVVTGKGGRLRDGEPTPGVLKRRVPEWLAACPDLVSGYAEAHRRDGGAGALYVFLRRRG